jgi:hypothetical protein
MNIEDLITVGGAVNAQGSPISILDLFIALLAAFLAGIWLAFVYRKTHRGMTYESSFVITMVLVGPIVSLIILLIGSNLALSLGMVGALSIIRFRNVIKDSRDMVYLFWAIAIGLGSGTYNWNVVFLASFLIGGALFLLDFLRYGRSESHDCVFVINGNGPVPKTTVYEILERHSESCTMRSAEIGDNSWELVFEVRFSTSDADELVSILDEVRGAASGANVSLLTPQVSLPV